LKNSWLWWKEGNCLKINKNEMVRTMETEWSKKLKMNIRKYSLKNNSDFRKDGMILKRGYRFRKAVWVCRYVYV
jgi:hypothetical protein